MLYPCPKISYFPSPAVLVIISLDVGEESIGNSSRFEHEQKLNVKPNTPNKFLFFHKNIFKIYISIDID